MHWHRSWALALQPHSSFSPGRHPSPQITWICGIMLLFANKWSLNLRTAMTVNVTVTIITISDKSFPWFVWTHRMYLSEMMKINMKLFCWLSSWLSAELPEAAAHPLPWPYLNHILFCIALISLLEAHHNTHTCGPHTQVEVKLCNKEHTVCQYNKCTN